MVCGRVRKRRVRWGGNSEEVVDRSVGYDRGGGGCCCSSDEARECFFAEDELELCDVWLCVCGMLAVGGGQYLYLCVTLKHMLNVDDSLTVPGAPDDPGTIAAPAVDPTLPPKPHVSPWTPEPRFAIMSIPYGPRAPKFDKLPARDA
ncbi:hypothetical protein C8Q76DRAFT_199814 [Earliella scabrosa]|nr:hypothetical protein C8Q76DRAFT_199814 [Earliella scabrosa]